MEVGPKEDLISLLKKRRHTSDGLEVVFLVGAGMSAAAGIPTTRQITGFFLEAQYLRDLVEGSDMPSGSWPSYEQVHSQLIKEIEKRGQSTTRFSDWKRMKYSVGAHELPSYFDVIRAAADEQIAPKFLQGHPALERLREENLAEFFQKISFRAKPDLGYHMLARFVENWQPCLKILTTNFDSLVARVLEERGIRHPYLRPWNKLAYYDTQVRADRRFIDIYYLHGERGTARILQPSLSPTAIAKIQEAFYRIGTATKDSILVVLGYGGREPTILAGIEALVEHPHVFNKGVWWHVRPESEIRVELTKRFEKHKSFWSRFNFVECYRIDLLLQEICDRVFEEPLEPLRLTKTPYPFMVQIPPPESKKLKVSCLADVLHFAEEKATLNSLVAKSKKVNMYILHGTGDLPSRVAAALTRHRTILDNFNICWCDLEECPDVNLLLPFLINFFCRSDPQVRLVPFFHGDVSQGREESVLPEEFDKLLHQLRSHKYLLVFDGLSRVPREKLKLESLVLNVIHWFCDPRSGTGKKRRSNARTTNSLGQSWCVLTVSEELFKQYLDQFMKWEGARFAEVDERHVENRTNSMSLLGLGDLEKAADLKDKNGSPQPPSEDEVALYQNIARILAHTRRPRSFAAVKYVAQKLLPNTPEQVDDVVEGFYAWAPSVGIEVAEGRYLWFSSGLRQRFRCEPILPAHVHDHVNRWLSEFYQLLFQVSGDGEALVEALWHLREWRNQCTTTRKPEQALLAAKEIISLLNSYRRVLISYGHLDYIQAIAKELQEQFGYNDAIEKSIRKITSQIHRDLTDFKRAIVDQRKLFDLSHKRIDTSVPIDKALWKMRGKERRQILKIDAARAIMEIGAARNGQRNYTEALRCLQYAANIALAKCDGTDNITQKKEWSGLLIQCLHRMVQTLTLKGDYSHAKFILEQALGHLGCGDYRIPILPNHAEGLHAFSVLQTRRSVLYRLSGEYQQARLALSLARIANIRSGSQDEIGQAVYSLHEAMIELEDPGGNLDQALASINNTLDLLPNTRHNIWWWTLAEIIHAEIHIALARCAESSGVSKQQLWFAEKAIERVQKEGIYKDKWRELELSVTECLLELTKIELEIQQGDFLRRDSTRGGSIIDVLMRLIRRLDEKSVEAVSSEEWKHYLMLSKINCLRGQCHVLCSGLYGSIAGKSENNNSRKERGDHPTAELGRSIRYSEESHEREALERFNRSIQLLRVLGVGKTRHVALEQAAKLMNKRISREDSTRICYQTDFCFSPVRTGLAWTSLYGQKIQKLREFQKNYTEYFIKAIGARNGSEGNKPDHILSVFRFINCTVSILGHECVDELRKLFNNPNVEERLNAYDTNWVFCFRNLLKAHKKRFEGFYNEAVACLEEVLSFVEGVAGLDVGAKRTLYGELLMCQLNVNAAQENADLSDVLGRHQIPEYSDHPKVDVLQRVRFYALGIQALRKGNYQVAENETSKSLDQLSNSLNCLESSLAARCYLLRGRARGYRGYISKAMSDIARGLLIAEEMRDRHVQAEGYYVLGRILFYKDLMKVSLSKDELDFDSEMSKSVAWVQRIFRDVRANGHKWETPVELGMAPLSVAWGLAESYDIWLQASILHQKARVQSELRDYDMAEKYLTKCFRFSDFHELTERKVDAARELIRCWLFKIYLGLEPTEGSEAWDRLKMDRSDYYYDVFKCAKARARDGSSFDTRCSLLARFWVSTAGQLGVKEAVDAGKLSLAINDIINSPGGVSVELPTLAGLLRDLRNLFPYEQRKGDEELREAVDVLGKRVDELSAAINATDLDKT